MKKTLSLICIIILLMITFSSVASDSSIKDIISQDNVNQFNTYDFIIISSENFSAELERLKEHKEQYEIKVDEIIAKKAKVALDKMIELS